MTTPTIANQEDIRMLGVGYATDTDLSRTRPETRAAKVLVVEDDEEMRSLVEEILREEGYLTFGAADTLSAMMHLLAEGADVIVTDWKMPALDGLDLIESVGRSLPGLPVIFVTAYADPELRRKALTRGAASFLAKPFQRDDLLSHIRAALSISRLRGKRRSHPGSHP